METEQKKTRIQHPNKESCINIFNWTAWDTGPSLEKGGEFLPRKWDWKKPKAKKTRRTKTTMSAPFKFGGRSSFSMFGAHATSGNPLGICRHFLFTTVEGSVFTKVTRLPLELTHLQKVSLYYCYKFTYTVKVPFPFLVLVSLCFCFVGDMQKTSKNDFQSQPLRTWVHFDHCFFISRLKEVQMMIYLPMLLVISQRE